MPEVTAVEYWWRNRNFPRDKAIVPGTDEVIKTSSAEQTYELWTARCAELGLEFPNILASFGDCSCKALPESLRDEACAKMSDAAPEVLRQKRLIGWRDIKAFFLKVASWWKAGECVSQDEADRRAAICAGCELNQTAFLPGCPGCTNMAAEVFKFIGGKKTASDAALKSCGHCGCQNSIIVWAPLDALVKNETELPPVPARCWKRME